jgi:nickel/cobalt exporter
MGRPSGTRLLVAALAVVAGLALPAVVAAHPLGNFTINHFAGLTIAPDRIDLAVVIDMAEIPAFQARQDMDADGDGSVADDEAATWATGACVSLVTNLDLRRDGGRLDLSAGASTVAFPPGAGGLSTLRLECAYSAALAPAIGGPATVTFSDSSYSERIGWREIIATAAGTLLDTHGLPATSPSARLTAYPAALIATPLDIRTASIDVRPDPAGLPTPATTPSTPLPGTATGGQVASAGGPGGAAGGPGGGTGTAGSATGAVPGGVAADLPDIFRTADLTPFVILASLLTAVVIGAGHALTPGHGKTLMAAYLVGSRGTAVHAVGLGLSVAVSHTLGILALAFVIVGAGSVLPPDVVYRVTPVIAGTSIVAIGGWMLASEVRRRRARRAVAVASSANGVAVAAADHEHAHAHEDHEHGHDAHDHDQGREHERHAHDHEHDDHQHPVPNGEHSHGGVTHSHLPPAGATLSWRGLFVLGLAGGLIPSTSALIILLGSIAAGRPAFGLILVVAFGLGMAAVMTGVGLAMILARTRLDRMPSRSSLGRLAMAAPLLASVAVLTLGLVLTWQAVAGTPVL